MKISREFTRGFDLFVDGAIFGALVTEPSWTLALLLAVSMGLTVSNRRRP